MDHLMCFLSFLTWHGREPISIHTCVVS
jgi:hypothetical protein